MAVGETRAVKIISKMMLSFDINLDGGKTLAIRLLSGLLQIDIGVLGERFQDSLLVLKLIDSVVEKLESPIYHINYGNPLGNYIFKDGILFQIQGNYFGILEINPNKAKNSVTLSMNQQSFEQIDKVEPGEIDFTFSMKPPATSSLDKPVILSPQQITEPLPYIKSRYYNILYSTSIPLSYFPKTALSRLKVLCNSKEKVKNVLKDVFLPIEVLNSRHSGNFGLLKTLNSGETHHLDVQYELSNQIDFISSNNLTPDSDMTSIVLKLKLRESQIQIIILLEILMALGLNEQDFLHNNKTPKTAPKVKRPSLIRKKKPNSKIVPTFLGMGVNQSVVVENASAKTGLLDSFTLLQTLDNLVERLSLWDTLYSEGTDTLLNYVGFVLVPYYRNKLPMTINYIASQIKGLSIKLKPSRPKRLSTSMSSSKSTDISSDLTNVSEQTKKKERPTLKKLSLDASTFAAPMKRSTSNLSSKNLHRRQVDFSMPAIKLKSMTDINNTIFSQPKRKKTETLSVKQATKSFSQVAATPVKRKPERPPPTIESIDSSPLRTPLKTPLNKKLNELMVSSPVSERNKPGTPMELKSPFLDLLMNGSPEQSIFKRAKKKKT